jgi:type IV pilus assembly protein PilA
MVRPLGLAAVLQDDGKWVAAGRTKCRSTCHRERILNMMKRPHPRGFTLIELMIVVAIIGILSAVAIPNFIRFQARAKQGEAKANLKALFSAQRSVFQEKDRYFTAIHEMGFAPERANRYAYSVGTGTFENRALSPAVKAATDTGVEVDTFKYSTSLPIPVRSNGGTPTWIPPPSTTAPPATWPGGVGGSCPNCEFSGFAAGNIDNELAGTDQWYIGSADSTVVPYNAAQENVPAGQPQNIFSDVSNDA